MALARAEILDAISSLSVLELSQLIKDMEEKFGVSAAAATVADGGTRRRRRCAASKSRPSSRSCSRGRATTR